MKRADRNRKRAKQKWQIFILSYLSRSLADCWGTTVDFTTSFLHSTQFLAFRSSIFHSRPVHSVMLSSHHFFCLPLHLAPWTIPYRIVLASSDDHVTCPYHFSMRLFTEVRRSSYAPDDKLSENAIYYSLKIQAPTKTQTRTLTLVAC